MIELFPEGFEEVALRRRDRVRRLHEGRRRRAPLAGVRAGGRDRRGGRVERGLEAVPPARADRPALGRPALGGARRGPRFPSSSILGWPSERAPTRRRSSAFASSSTHEPVSLLDLGCGSGVLSIAAAKLGYEPVTALDLDEAAVAAHAYECRGERRRAHRGAARRPLGPAAARSTSHWRTSPASRWSEVARRIEAAGARSRPGTSSARSRSSKAGSSEERQGAPGLGRRPLRARLISTWQLPPSRLASGGHGDLLELGFLGCKVSHTDAQELRERLVADGHVEARRQVDVAVVNTCCVTHEAVRKSRQEARRAARRARRVYVTGCAANLEGSFDGLPANVEVVRASERERPSTSSPAPSGRSAASRPTSGSAGCAPS